MEKEKVTKSTKLLTYIVVGIVIIVTVLGLMAGTMGITEDDNYSSSSMSVPSPF